MERAGVRRIKLRIFLFPPHPSFSLWGRLSLRDKVRVSEYLQFISSLTLTFFYRQGRS